MEFSEIDATAITRRLDSVSDEKEVKNIIEDFCGCLSLDWYIFAVSQIASLNSPTHQVITNALHWMTEYSEKAYQKSDPVVKYILANQSAVTWNSFDNLDGYSDPEQREVIERADEMGLKAGFSIPCNSFAQFAVLSFADSNRSSYEKFDSIIPYASVFATRLLEASQRIESAAAGKGVNLTARELECLMWGSEGKTAWEISKILGVSERTVVFHFTNAATKLNASNRQHAISKALLLGLVKPKF